MPTIDTDVSRLLALVRAQRPDPLGWSLAADRRWLEHTYFGPGVSLKLWDGVTGELIGCAAVRASGDEPCLVVSMLRPGCEDLWGSQLEWIEATIDDAADEVRVVSECLDDAEVRRWTAAGFDLTFEELAMEVDLIDPAAAPRWPPGAELLEWGPATAIASFEVYEAAFRERPGFPGWSQAEWIQRLTVDDDFLPEASLCVVVDGAPAGFVVADTGHIVQVGVVPASRRLGLASALVLESTARMRARGIRLARLHVNVNNPGSLATWRKLGWRIVGRRGRFVRIRTGAGL